MTFADMPTAADLHTARVIREIRRCSLALSIAFGLSVASAVLLIVAIERWAP